MNISSNVLTFAYGRKYTRFGFRQEDCVGSWGKSEPWNKNGRTQFQLLLLSRWNTCELKDYAQRKSCYPFFFKQITNLILKL